MINLKKINLTKIYLVLLLHFFIVILTLTLLARIKYNTSLTHVQTVQTIEKEIEHSVEYIVNINKNEHSFNWLMDENDRFVEEGDSIWLYAVELQNEHNRSEKIAVSYEKKEKLEGVVTKILLIEDTKQYYIEAQLKNVTEWIFISKDCIAEINYIGQKQAYVIPISSVISDDNGDLVYVVKSEEKVWGTSYYLKKVPIIIIESNGEEVATKYFPGEEIVLKAKDFSLYDGLLINYEKVE